MNRLDPPPKQRERYGWDVLRQTLNANFSEPSINPNELELPINLNEYYLNKDEIIKELELVGYKATEDKEFNRLIVQIDN